eukprot:566156-Pelagomonas_calceolata.AAC.3
MSVPVRKPCLQEEEPLKPVPILNPRKWEATTSRPKPVATMCFTFARLIKLLMATFLKQRAKIWWMTHPMMVGIRYTQSVQIIFPMGGQQLIYLRPPSSPLLSPTE